MTTLVVVALFYFDVIDNEAKCLEGGLVKMAENTSMGFRKHPEYKEQMKHLS
jgi:hypothetical protein